MTKLTMKWMTQLLIFAISLFVTTYAQNKPRISTDILILKWELLHNNYLSKDQALCRFEITNNSKLSFPEKGWTIYFNSNKDINAESVSEGFRLTHFNGDIFMIKPSKDFKTLLPGQSINVSYICYGQVLNYTDVPLCPYLVWDDEPKKGITIKNYEVQKLKNNISDIVTPEMVYNRNAEIKELPNDSLPKIFPTPSYFQQQEGKCDISPAFSITCDKLFDNEKKYLEETLKQLFFKASSVKSTASKTGATIQLKRKEMKPEAYELSVNEKEITISAADGAGIFYGIQSLFSMLPASSWTGNIDEISLPQAIIKDEPRFSYRSFHLDVARNFKPKKEILKVIDLMSIYKLNILHFHFSDDEGWRIEIPSLPELTEVGSQRGHTTDSKTMLPASYGAGPEPGVTLGSGYYTRNDFIEILKYANARHIKVIPEIETPGHSRAAIKSMDARYVYYMSKGDKVAAEEYLLRDLNDKSVYSSAQQWTDNVMCVALPSVYHFLDKVTDELISMYKEAGAPISTIHMGGDEVPEGAWKESPLCKALLQKNNEYHETNDLWYYYYDSVYAMLKRKNLFMSGWEEMGMRKTKLDGNTAMIVNSKYAAKDIQLHVWNNMVGWGNEDLPYKLANAGFKVVLSPVSNNYFDLAYYKSPDEPGYYWGGFEDIDKPFYFIPFDYYKTTKEDAAGEPVFQSAFKNKERLTEYGKTNIVGIEGLLWAENLRTTDQLEYLLLPKLLGLAERAWASDPDWAKETDSAILQNKYNEAWSVFVNRVGKYELPKLDNIFGGFNYRIPPPGLKTSNGYVYANEQFPGLTIRYTSDGTDPFFKSKTYNKPVPYNKDLKFATFNSKGRKSRVVSAE